MSNNKENLSALERMRNKRASNKVSNESTIYSDSKEQDKFHVRRWFNEIRENFDLLDEMIKYYEHVIKNVEKHINFNGLLVNLVQETPGIQYYYRGFLVDVQQTRRFLEEIKSNKEGLKYKWFMYSHDAKKEYGDVKTTEASKLAKIDDEVVDLALKIRKIANIEHILENIDNAITQRAIMLSHIVNIRKEGLEEVWVDPSKETTNE